MFLANHYNQESLVKIVREKVLEKRANQVEKIMRSMTVEKLWFHLDLINGCNNTLTKYNTDLVDMPYTLCHRIIQYGV